MKSSSKKQKQHHCPSCKAEIVPTKDGVAPAHAKVVKTIDDQNRVWDREKGDYVHPIIQVHGLCRGSGRPIPGIQVIA